MTERAFDGLTVIGLLVYALFAAGLPRDVAVGGVGLEAVATRAGILCLLLLAGGLFVVLFPVLSEAVRGVKITVGPPFFDKVNGPLALGLIFLMGVGPLIAWRRTSLDHAA